ncbi:hypothetical protein ROLI_036590 [Roseobacter fucihabitans]|uniref:Uncharacterized protein n=1 Tax=Roseobacter fucihabitans TaxID=1537242 RepID=A0ABZ2BYY3_9RHOB|nr:hypothetical protein [Roseobacter litoralis]MBC6966313.1 hypothetical protein [Roseobacter litoralis]
MALPNLTLRTATQHHDLMRRVNMRLRDDPGFVQVLGNLVGDKSRTSYMPSEEIEARFRHLEEHVKALEERVFKRLDSGQPDA